MGLDRRNQTAYPPPPTLVVHLPPGWLCPSLCLPTGIHHFPGESLMLDCRRGLRPPER